ncbi:acyltransferase family protein [Butyrivibrio sp. YAB3001]|uniref:acyltransferase family protein n=1 Tax=Butyrivibrio sp. YAB3001 TaxID=1520812 RepID=UPI0008F68E05|nr:acyltransferase family protein [Butyrivibrio sp. YAB3001]SFB68290.1 Membrane-bound acyltransferase YfiQ, involved in biofilm formation [Butyrivibrio sp. YAB3001]
MKQLIYSVYVILPILLLWRASFVGVKKWNDGFLSLEQTKAFQGFLAVCIMLHHIGQKTAASWIQPKSRIVHGLDMFVPIGYLLVAIFLFFNGYGVYKSFHSKPNYLNGYVKKRILPVILALYSTTLIFFVVRLLIGEKMDGKQVLLYLTSIDLCNPNTWYVIVLPFFYLAFYLSFKFIKKDGLAVAATTAFVVLYQLLGTRINHNDFWIRGEWWYNCVHLFPIGIIFAKYENKIIPHVKKYYWAYLIVALAAFYPLYVWSGHMCDIFGYYGENWGAPDVVLRRRISLLSQVVLTTEFVFCWLLLGMKVKIGNAFLKFMGTITLEFYLIHGLFVELFGWQFDGGVRSPHHIKYVIVYVLVVFALGVPSAILLKKFHKFVLGLGKKKECPKEEKALSA